MALPERGLNERHAVLGWLWQANLKKESMAAALMQWKQEGADAVIWDNASGHKAKALQALQEAAPARAFLPPYSPELSPAECLFEEVRRHVEGKLYASMNDKKQTAEAYIPDAVGSRQRARQKHRRMALDTRGARLAAKSIG